MAQWGQALILDLGADTDRGVRAVKTSRRRLACPRPRMCRSIGPIGRRSGGPRLWSICRQTEMTQDALHGGAVLDERQEAEPPATAGTRQHVEPEGPALQLGPEIRTRSLAG
jgi:hypothetical protein